MIMAIFTTGCTLVPRYERPQTPVAEAYNSASTDANSTTVLPAWDTFCTDPQLQSLIHTALSNNRDWKTAVLKVALAHAQYNITSSENSPSIAATGSLERSKSIDGAGSNVMQGNSSSISNVWTASIGVTSYDIDLFGRIKSLDQQALEQYYATDEARHAARIVVEQNVANAYFTWRQDQEQVLLAELSVSALRESYSVTYASAQAGASNALDAYTAESQVHEAVLSLSNQELQCGLDRNALELVVGRPLTLSLPEPKKFSDIDFLLPVAPGLPSALLERRPDILQAEHILKASNANIGAARAAFFPSINLTGSAGSTSIQLSSLLSPGTGFWSIMPQINIPIFSGGLNRANLAAAMVNRRLEVASYEKAIQVAFREVSDALLQTSIYEREISEQKSLIEADQKRVELATIRYRSGDDVFLNILSAQRDLYSAQSDLIKMRLNRLKSQVALYAALGGG